MEETGSFGDVSAIENNVLEIDNDDGSLGNLKLEVSQAIVLDPVAQAQKTMMSQQPQRLSDTDQPKAASPSVVKPPKFDITKSQKNIQVSAAPKPSPVADEIDFGAMSSDEEEAAFQRPVVQAPAPQAKVPPPAPSAEERTMRVQMPANEEPDHFVSAETRHDTKSDVIPITRATDRSIDRGGATEIRVGIKVPPAPREASSGPSYGSMGSSSEAALKQSDTLRIAQNRITELERELERVRRDNESLSTAGDTLRRRTDELSSKAESLEIQAREAQKMLEEEKRVMRGQLQTKERENGEMRTRVEEIETRLESNFKKIRVRERELEHRLEIVKMESATLVSTKDKMILDLKRQIDQLHHEGDSAKNKTQELFSQYKTKQETIRRVVRALRIALTILEGDDETVAPTRKAE